MKIANKSNSDSDCRKPFIRDRADASAQTYDSEYVDKFDKGIEILISDCLPIDNIHVEHGRQGAVDIRGIHRSHMRLSEAEWIKYEDGVHSSCRHSAVGHTHTHAQSISKQCLVRLNTVSD